MLFVRSDAIFLAAKLEDTTTESPSYASARPANNPGQTLQYIWRLVVLFAVLSAPLNKSRVLCAGQSTLLLEHIVPNPSLQEVALIDRAQPAKAPPPSPPRAWAAPPSAGTSSPPLPPWARPPSRSSPPPLPAAGVLLGSPSWPRCWVGVRGEKQQRRLAVINCNVVCLSNQHSSQACQRSSVIGLAWLRLWQLGTERRKPVKA